MINRWAIQNTPIPWNTSWSKTVSLLWVIIISNKLPSGKFNIAIENGPVEIVDFPINSMVDLSIVMWLFTRPDSLQKSQQIHQSTRLLPNFDRSAPLMIFRTTASGTKRAKVCMPMDKRQNLSDQQCKRQEMTIYMGILTVSFQTYIGL